MDKPIDKLKIIQDSRGYVVINENGRYKNHAHLKKYSTCELLIKLIKRKIVPKSSYLRISCLRLTLDGAYKDKIMLKQAKDREKLAYFNVNKGASR